MVVKLTALSSDQRPQLHAPDLEWNKGACRNSLPCEDFLDAPSGATGVTTGRAALNQMSAMLTLKHMTTS